MEQTPQSLKTSLSPRGVATLELYRPDRGNALNSQLVEELSRTLGALSEDPEVRVILLRGAGKHFCVGADLAERGGQQPPGPSPATRVKLPELLAMVDDFPKPIIALVQGGCVGAGVALASCCDVVVARDDAFFSFPELRLGLVPSQLLPYFVRSIGLNAFRRYGLSGERMPAIEAHRLGLAHAHADTQHAEQRVAEIVDAMLHAAPGAARQLKRRLEAYRTMPAVEQSGAEDPARRAEIEEGTASFREKRKPRWYPPDTAAADPRAPSETA